MNYLCVCQYGHSRSVALARVLHGLGRSAVACGWGTAGTGLPHLCWWADKILILDSGFIKYIPETYRFKIVDFHVGPDRWSNPYNQELLGILKQMVNEKLPEVVL